MAAAVPRRRVGGGWRLLGAALLLAVTAQTVAGAAQGPPPCKALPFRLPDDVLPANYTLRITTHFGDDNFRFYGQMSVDVDVVRDTSEVRLHAKMLKVDQKSVTLVPLGQKKRKKKPPKGEQQPTEDEDDDNAIPDPAALQVGKPAQKPEKPTGPPGKPDQNPVKPQQKPEKPAEQPEKPTDQSGKPDLKPDKPSQKPEKPAEQPEKPEKPAEKPEKPAEKPTEKPEKPAVKPTEKPEKPAEKPTEKPEKPAEKPTEKPEKPAEKPTEKPEKPTDQSEKPDLKPDKPPQKPEKPTERPEKPDPKPEKITEQTQKPDQKPDEPAEQPAQGQDKPEQQANKPVLQLDTPAQEKDSPALPEGVKKGVEKEDKEGPPKDEKQQDQQQQQQQQEEEDKAPEGRQQGARAGHYQHAAGDVSFKALRLANVSMDATLEQLVVTPAKPLKAGSRYRLTVHYWGTLNTEDRGYFRGSYQLGNQTRWVSSTVFEPTHARRAFPCFDEPAMKANFTLVLGRHANYSSSANMPLSRTEPMTDAPGWFWDFYPATPKMSTYLVAFMVHNLEGSKLSNFSDPAAVPVRAWAAPGRVHMANFSLYVAPRVLAMLGDRLSAPPVMPKHDLVVVPGFQSEALENWGLVSFEDRNLLLTASAGQLSKQSVATVVGHELAHIWFGNMVTPAWWSDIWLSEGFATYYAAEAIEKIFPGWRSLETTAGNAFLLIASIDSLPDSLPVIRAADKPQLLESVFGAISYYKGYWMLRMLHSALGPGVFDAAVRRYIQRHQYSSVRTQDFWAALQETVDARADLDLLEAASEGDDVVVVSDGSDDEELARVVVPGAGTEAASTASVTSPATAASVKRVKRDGGQAPVLGSLALGMADPYDKSGMEALDRDDDEDRSDSLVGQDAAVNATPRPEDAVAAVDKTVAATAAADGQDKKASEDIQAVQSPPRRGPAPTSFLGKVGWLPRPVDQIMRNWVQRPGYPIISMYRNLDTGVVTLNQRRFVGGDGSASGDAKPCDASSAAWWIPVRYATSRPGVGAAAAAATASSQVFWMPPTCANVTLPVKVGRDDWVLLNAGLAALFRVRYDPRTLQQLSRLPRAAWLQVAPLSRVQLVADSLDLAHQGRASYQHVLRLVNHLGRDPNPLVWRAALRHLLLLQQRLRGRRDGVALRSWLQDLVSPHAASIGFTTRVQDSPQQASLRVKVTTLACQADHSSCQRKARKALKLYMAGDPEAIVPGRLTQAQLCAAVRWGSPSEWRFLRAQLSTPNSKLPRRAVITALGCSRDQETLRSLLAETVSPNSTLRRSDVAAVLASVAANEVGGDATLRFMEERAAELYNRLGDSPFKVERVIREVATTLSSMRQLDRLDAVLRQFQSQTPSRSPPTWGRDIVRENMRWAERSRAEVSRWLRARLDDDDLELRGPSTKPSKAPGIAHNVSPVVVPAPKPSPEAPVPKVPKVSPGGAPVPKVNPGAPVPKVTVGASAPKVSPSKRHSSVKTSDRTVSPK